MIICEGFDGEEGVPGNEAVGPGTNIYEMDGVAVPYGGVNLSVEG